MDKDIVVIGSGPILNVLSAAGLKWSVPIVSNLWDDSIILSTRQLPEDYTPRRTGVAKARRVARKKRAKKIARRR